MVNEIFERIRDGLRWRLLFVHRYLFLVRSFRNGVVLAVDYRRGMPCDRAVLWDGTALLHPPGRSGFIETLLEILDEQVYTRDFYQPRPGDVVIDAGANVGIFTSWLSRVEPGCRILAFEPFRENFALLSQNLQKASPQNVTLVLGALSGDSGFATIDDGGSRSLDHKLRHLASGSDADAVKVYSMADALDMGHAATIALFKIDIEGSEHDLFVSCSNDSLKRVQRFAIEYHDNIKPGTLQQLTTRLAPTHRLSVKPAGTAGHGMLYATLNS